MKGMFDEPDTPLVPRQGWCPFCKQNAELIVMEQRTNEYEGIPESIDRIFADDTSLFSATVWQCGTCGWWDVQLEHIEGVESEWEMENEASFRVVLRAYDCSDLQLPITALRQELVRRQETIHRIHDKKMEQLVASVLEDFFPGCEVTVCGKSGDGGVDLVLMLSDTPFAVQVKRRTKPGSTESVEAIRAFLGASLLRGYDHLLYVTSADRFTGGPYGAQTEAERALERKLVRRFYLVDKHRFFEMLKLTTSPNAKPWLSPLPDIFQDL
jgi:hypothetical protein